LSLTVKAFAEEIGIHPGNVVGRLPHDGIIPLSWMNGLKETFDFKSNSG
jgi:HTH-type transcriptional regulator/antitoxin HigA